MTYPRLKFFVPRLPGLSLLSHDCLDHGKCHLSENGHGQHPKTLCHPRDLFLGFLQYIRYHHQSNQRECLHRGSDCTSVASSRKNDNRKLNSNSIEQSRAHMINVNYVSISFLNIPEKFLPRDINATVSMHLGC